MKDFLIAFCAFVIAHETTQFFFGAVLNVMEWRHRRIMRKIESRKDRKWTT